MLPAKHPFPCASYLNIENIPFTQPQVRDFKLNAPELFPFNKQLNIGS